MKLSFWSLRQWLLFGAVFIVVSVVAWFGYYKWYPDYRPYNNRPQSHQVQGQFKTGSESELRIFGIHILDAYPENSDVEHPQLFKVNITSDTKFFRTTYSSPALGADAVWDPSMLKTETTEGSLNDFKNQFDTALTIKTTDNTIGQNVITASEIYYTLTSQNGKEAVKTFSISGQVVSVAVSSMYLKTATSAVTVSITTDTRFAKLIKQADGTLSSVPTKQSDIKPGMSVAVLTYQNIFTDKYISAQQVSIVSQ